jgi:hypothetical protein
MWEMTEMGNRMILETPSDTTVDDLEKQLQLKLRPVEPNPVFVKHLGNRLTTPSYVVYEEPDRAASYLAYIMVAFGLVFGTLLAWLIRRFR